MIGNSKNFYLRCLHFSGIFLHRIWLKKIVNPVFIVGAPRSGTSLLGQILGKADNIYYLPEPRFIWTNLDRRLDIWDYKYPIKWGKLFWKETDINQAMASRLARWLHYELFFSRGSRLVEKTPLNVFRMTWLFAMFPEAKFIHLIRHGKDVALSAAEQFSRWFPQGYWESSRHYGIFKDYASSDPLLGDKLSHITEDMDNYPRGLFIWLCSVTAGRKAGEQIGPGQYLEVQYEALTDNPTRSLEEMFSFIDEPLNQEMIHYAQALIHRNSINKSDPDPEITALIAGELLDELAY